MSRRVTQISLFSAVIGSLALFAGWSFGQPEEIAKDSAALLPAQAVIYMRIDGSLGHEAAFEKTAAYQALYESGLMDVLNSAMERLGDDEQTAELAGIFEHLQQYGFSLAIAVEAPDQAPVAAWGTIVVPFAAEGVDLLGNVIENLPNQNVEVQRTKVKGRQVRFIDLQNPLVELGWWAEDNNLVIGFGMNAISNSIAVAEGERKNITTHRLWKELSNTDEDFEVTQVSWFDSKSLREMFGEKTVPTGKADSPKVNDVLAVLGLQNLNHAATLSGYRGKSLWTQVSIDAPGERTGLLSLLDQETFTLKDLPAIPLHHVGLAAFTFNPNKAYETLIEIIYGLGEFGPPNASEQIDRGLAQIQQELGFDPQDLLQSLGSLHCFYTDSSQTSFGLGTVALVAVKDQETLVDCLRKLFARIAREADRKQQGLFRVNELTGNGQTVFELNFPKAPFFTPTFSVGEDWVIGGLMPQAVSAQEMRMDGDLYNWSIEEDLADAFEVLPKEFTSLRVVDPAGTYRLVLGLAPTIVNFVEMGLRESRNVPANWEMPINVNEIPPAELVVQDLFVNVAVSTVDEKSWTMYSRQSLPGVPFVGGSGGSSVSVGTIAVLTALILPAVQQAREAARRSQSRNNLKMLGLAMHNYHDTHRHFPQGTVPNEDLEPEERLSFLVSLLPFIEQAALYNVIDLKSGWNADDNKRPLSRVVPTFQNPSQSKTGEDNYATTHYIGIAGVGKDAATLPVTDKRAGVFGYNRVTRIRDIRDGTSNTVMISDASEIARWGEGGPATIRSLTKKPYINGPDGIGSPHAGGAQMVLADGSVRFISEKIDPSVMEALSTINGGEVLPRF